MNRYYLSSKWNRVHTIVSRRIYRAKRAAFIFYHTLRGREIVHLIHVRKAGGTAVSNAVRRHRVTKKYALVLERHSFTLKKLPENHKFVFFIRDPVERFISGFYDRKLRGVRNSALAHQGYYHAWRPEEKQAFENFDNAEELALSLVSADPKKKAAAIFAMNNIRHVNSSFWDWFISEDVFAKCEPQLLFAGRQETLADDFEKLKAILMLPADVQLPKDPAKSRKTDDNLKQTLSERSREIIRCHYLKDYAFIRRIENTLG